MIRRILAATDGSEASMAAVRYASLLAKKHGAAMTLLYVVDIKLLEGPVVRDLSSSLGSVPFMKYQGIISRLLEDRGEEALKKTGALCSNEGISTEILLRTGLVHRVIVEHAHLADLIVMGRSGEHTPFLEGLMGSTTEAVVRRAPIPVLIVSGKVSDSETMVVAYDGSRQAKKALRFAAELAEHEKRPLQLLAVGDEAAEAWLNEARDYLHAHPNAESYTQRSGEPETEILRFVEEQNAGLLVMGAYGRGKLYELVLGSTTSHVLNHANCPVLLVR